MPRFKSSNLGQATENSFRHSRISLNSRHILHEKVRTVQEWLRFLFQPHEFRPLRAKVLQEPQVAQAPGQRSGLVSQSAITSPNYALNELYWGRLAGSPNTSIQFPTKRTLCSQLVSSEKLQDQGIQIPVLTSVHSVAPELQMKYSGPRLNCITSFSHNNCYSSDKWVGIKCHLHYGNEHMDSLKLPQLRIKKQNQRKIRVSGTFKCVSTKLVSCYLHYKTVHSFIFPSLMCK